MHVDKLTYIQRTITRPWAIIMSTNASITTNHCDSKIQSATPGCSLLKHWKHFDQPGSLQGKSISCRCLSDFAPFTFVGLVDHEGPTGRPSWLFGRHCCHEY